MDFCLRILFFLFFMCFLVNGNVVFQVQHKFGGRHGRNLKHLRAHDAVRHGRMLANVDFELGGDGSPTNAALYYTKITVGTPPVDYHVQVDTGSDILWVNCKNCDKCPTTSDLNVPLRRYDLSASSTGKMVGCDDDFCDAAFSHPNPNCKAGMKCEYSVSYGDGSVTSGYFVRDYFTFSKISANLQTTSMNGSISFGCSDKQSGELGSSTEAVDGIIGFGQANSSILSQLASNGMTKKVFSHCLDGAKGGGIFAIGEVVHPKVNRTQLVPNSAHYNVVMKGVDVGGESLDLPFSFFGLGSSRGAIIDSGTTLAYLPLDLYKQLLTKMMAKQPKLETHEVEQFTCFWYKGNIDDGFPVVNFHFDNALPLSVYPHDYLFEVHENEYCIGWQTKWVKSKDEKEITLLGDIVLSDKLILYDLENMTIGWTEYNCSSSIEVGDEKTGGAYAVSAHNISSAASQFFKVNILTFILLIAALLNLVQ